MNTSLLEIKDLSLRYQIENESVYALNDVSLSLEKGQAVGIVGESGCGKSTLAKAIIRLLPASCEILNGEICYQGRNILEMSDEELRKMRGSQIGMIFQNPMTALNPIMKMRDQIYEVLKQQNMSKVQMKERAIELYKMVGIPAPEKRLNEYIHQYSGGMRQRAMIATVLASNPELLIADEPTTALDVTIQKQIIDLLNHLRKEMNMSILLITHDLGVVNELCDRIVVMYAGSVVEISDREQLFTTPCHPYTIGLLNSLPKEHDTRTRLEPIVGMPPRLKKRPMGCLFADRCPRATDECKKKIPVLQQMDYGHFVACFHKE